MCVERILDEALVVRGGRNRPEDIKRGTGTHPSGITGISVECGVGLSISELALLYPSSTSWHNYGEDLEVDGVVQYSTEENLWVAAIDWNTIQQLEDLVVQQKLLNS